MCAYSRIMNNKFTARLDGINKPLRHTTFEDYLQIDGWEPPKIGKPGQKRVIFILF